MCVREGCDLRAVCRGLCQKHYNAQSCAAYHAANRDKIKARKAAHYLANKARISAHNAGYREENREKVKAAKAAYVQTDRGAELNRAGRRRRRAAQRALQQPNVEHLRNLPCALCGAEAPSAVDHIVPLSWAPGCPYAVACCEDPRCYQPLCKSCNSSKNNRGVWALVPTGDIG